MAKFQWETDGVPIATADTVAILGRRPSISRNPLPGPTPQSRRHLILKAGTHKVGDTVATVEEFHVVNCTGGTGALAGSSCTPTTTTQDWPVVLTAANKLEIGVSLHQLNWVNPEHNALEVAATSVLTGGMAAEINPGNVTTPVLSTGEELLWNGKPLEVSGTVIKTGLTNCR